MELNTLAIDLAKDFFQLYGINNSNKAILDKKVGRARFPGLIKKLEPTQIFMEACGGAHHWARMFRTFGHKVKLIAPHHVKPFVGHQKNDRNDAKAILEACRRPEAVFVGVKTIWQQDLQSLHKVRDLKLKQQVAMINHIRGLMIEYGVALPKTHSKFKTAALKEIENGNNDLSPTIRELCIDTYNSYKEVTEKIKSIDKQLLKISSSHEFTIRAQKEIKGVGPLIVTKFIASIGEIDNFSSGRQVSAWLGLVPKQHSTGGKTRLGRITKHGDNHLRKLVIQGARSAVTWANIKDYGDDDTNKIRRLCKEKGFNVASVAVANRNVRRMFAILKKYNVEECAS